MDTVGIRVGAIRKSNEEATLSIEKRILFWGGGLIVFAMLVHLLAYTDLSFDYLVGGFFPTFEGGKFFETSERGKVLSPEHKL